VTKLIEYIFETENKNKKSRNLYWNKKLMQETFDNLKFNFIDYMKNDDAVLKRSLESLTKYGLMIVNKVRIWYLILLSNLFLKLIFIKDSSLY
jgi:hypothetical protein